jgi:hypothetical protein
MVTIDSLCCFVFHRDEGCLYAHAGTGLFDHFAGGRCRDWFLVQGRIFLDGPGKYDAIGHPLKGQKNFVVRSPWIFHGVDALVGGARVVDDGVHDLIDGCVYVYISFNNNIIHSFIHHSLRDDSEKRNNKEGSPSKEKKCCERQTKFLSLRQQMPPLKHFFVENS